MESVGSADLHSTSVRSQLPIEILPTFSQANRVAPLVIWRLTNRRGSEYQWTPLKYRKYLSIQSRQGRSSDNAAVTTAQTSAANAKQTAEDALKSQEQQVASEQKTLQQELGEVQASSIDADGTYIVGQDVKPGTYHTNGSGNVGANDCYYAMLSSTNGSIYSIISNNNFDGPETISLSGVYAFQINGSCTWVMVPL